MDAIPGIIKDILSSIGYPTAEIETLEIGGQTIFSIKNVADTRELIGAHGDTIHALDHIVKKIVEKKTVAQQSNGESVSTPMFLVDVDEYRTKQIKDIQTKAKMMAERARSFQYDVELSPMSAYERLIVHTTLQDEPNVKTESQGEGRSRRVVIRYLANKDVI